MTTGSKIRCCFDPLDPDPGWKKIWIRDPRKKHPGSATLEMTLKKTCELVVDSKISQQCLQ
jgi:hypothetical protein